MFSTVVGPRDLAVIAAMTSTFARVGAVAALAVEDYCRPKKRWWLPLRKKKRQAERDALPLTALGKSETYRLWNSNPRAFLKST